MEFRNESKYIINKHDMIILEDKLKYIMPYDYHSNNKSYNIRSIYFDSYDDKCFYSNVDGENKRFKLRIRIYNRCNKEIKLEYKYKENGFVKKDFCFISKELCSKLLDGKMLSYSECTNRVLKKLYLEQQTCYFKPKIIVEYDRVAFCDKLGNVRITFDMNIRTSKYLNRVFLKNIFSKPILDLSKCVLEIKYDEFLPDYIASLINLKNINRISFSKYYLSRIELKEDVL